MDLKRSAFNKRESKQKDHLNEGSGSVRKEERRGEELERQRKVRVEEGKSALSLCGESMQISYRTQVYGPQSGLKEGQRLLR